MRSRRVLAMSVLPALLAASAPALAAGAGPDWPCQQRKVLQISPGQVWSGPPLDSVGNEWRNDRTVADLARTIAERRTDIEEAESLIARFAQGAGDRRNEQLTALAAGMLSIINSERAQIMAGIERYWKRQRSLAAKIERQMAELEALPQDGTPEEAGRREELAEIQAWDTRIFQEREQSLAYVCELPVRLEQRAFALARAIQEHLDR